MRSDHAETYLVTTMAALPRAALYGGTLALCLLVVVSAHVAAAAKCRTSPAALVPARDTAIVMQVASGMACPVSARSATAVVEDLTITTAPAHGTVTARGRTGVTYRPDPAFRGEDFFAFEMRGAWPQFSGTWPVQVRVMVK